MGLVGWALALPGRAEFLLLLSWVFGKHSRVFCRGMDVGGRAQGPHFECILDLARLHISVGSGMSKSLF